MQILNNQKNFEKGLINFENSIKKHINKTNG